MSLKTFIQSSTVNKANFMQLPSSSSSIHSTPQRFSRCAAIFSFGIATLFFAITSASKADSSNRKESPVTLAINSVGVLVDASADVSSQSNPQDIAPFGTLDIQFPSEIVWTTSRTKTPSPDRKTLIVKGRDVNGPTQLIISQFDKNFAAKLWDGAGVQWEAIGNIANPIRFNKVFKGKEQNCGGTPPVPPEIQAQFPAGGNEGGIAGSGACIDSQTLDVLVAYSPCALQQFYRATFFVPPPGPQCPALPPAFDPDAALALLRTAVFLQEDAINESFDNSLISTPTRERHIKIVAVVDTNQAPECQPGTWVPSPVDPGYTCYQPEFDPEADPQTCDPLEPKWCGEDFGFAADLDRVANPNDPDYGGLLTQKRDYHRADMVVLLRVTGLEGIGGIARIKTQNTGCDGSTGFCVVDVMGMGSMGHEIGHNLGCCHEPGQGGSFNCSMFPYSFGHRFTVAGPPGGGPVEKKTIMAYATGEGIPNYSNPFVLSDGEPTGTSQTQYPYWSDNARTIRETFDDARCYRCADVTPPAPLQGPVTCWGSNSKGQSTPPADLGDCSRVSAGYLHTLAIQADGTVRAWGAGTTSTSVSPNYGQSLVPVNLPEPPYGDGYPLGTCFEVSAGLYHSVAIRTRIIDGTPENELLDGTVVCWGAGLVGQQSPNYGQSITPQNLGPCTKVSAGHYHTLALQRSGIVRAWGAGQNDAIFPNLGQSAVPNIGPCTDIAAGGYHSVAIKYGGVNGAGLVVAWGAGKTNTSFQTEWGQSIVPVTLGTCTRVAAGVFHTVALKLDGTVRAFGAGTTNTGIFPRFGQSIVPTNLGSCTDIAAGGAYVGSSGSHTLAIKSDKSILGWGANSNEQTSVPAVNSDWIQISAGGLHSAAIKMPIAILPCQGDFNSDRKRDGLDLTFILSAWGTANGDINGDGTTNGLDMSYLLSGWGSCP